MKIKISIFITTITFLLLGVTIASAQGTNAYFKKNGATVFQSPIADIDSIVFKQADSLTEEELQVIISSYENINKLASPILLEAETGEDFEKIMPDIQNYPMVEKSWIDDNSLMVKFKKGGIISWSIQPDFNIPSDMNELNVEMSNALRASESLNKPSNSTACLINQLSADENNQGCKTIISYLYQGLETNGYKVVTKDVSQADVDFFKKDLNKYGVVFCISHGIYDSINDLTWLYTGEEVNFSKLRPEFTNYWRHEYVQIDIVEEIRNGTKTPTSYYLVSNKFFEAAYAQNSFPNSLIYLAACRSMKSLNLARTLSSKRVGVTIGWDEKDCKGPYTGLLLFNLLLANKSVADAYKTLSPNDKKDYCGVPAGANLIYYPLSGENMYLIGEEKPPVISISNITSTTATATVTIDPAKIRDGNTDKGTPVSVSYCISPYKNFGNGDANYYSNGAEIPFSLSQNAYTFNNLTFKGQPLKSDSTYYIYGWVKFSKAGNYVLGWDNSYPTGNTWVRANDPSPSGWRVPTYDEIQKLLDTNHVAYEWINNNRLTGGKFTDRATGNAIFLPVAGYRSGDDGALYYVGDNGGYWSSTANVTNGAYRLSFDSGNADTDSGWWYNYDRSYGFSVRPVAQ